MQVLTTFLFTMATLLLLSTAVKASPVLVMGDDESSPKDLTGLGAEQSKQFKRICGMSFYCQRFTVKRIVTKFSICFRITNIHFENEVSRIVAEPFYFLFFFFIPIFSLSFAALFASIL